VCLRDHIVLTMENMLVKAKPRLGMKVKANTKHKLPQQTPTKVNQSLQNVRQLAIRQ